MHDPTNKLPSHSVEHNRLAMLQQEEEMTYKAFQLDNFYQNNRLNLVSLKDRIDKFKKGKHNPNQNPIHFTVTGHSQTQHMHKNQNTSFHTNHQNNIQFVPSSHTKLQRILVPPSQQQKRQILTSKLGHFSNELKHNQTNPNRNRVTSQMISEFRTANQHQEHFVRSGHQNGVELRKQIENPRQQTNYPRRDNVIKSHFDKYQTVSHYDPEFIANQKQLSIKRQKTQENLRPPKQISQKTRYNNITATNNHNKNLNQNQKPLPTRSREFKIQPITTGAKRQQRYSQKSRPNPNARSTQKSFIGSQKQSRVSLNINSLNKSIHIVSQYQLDKLEALIARLWGLYEMLTSVMQRAVDEPFTEEQQVQKYVEEICGEGYEQVVGVLETVNCKRLTKAVKMGKMLENLSMVYLFLQVARKKKSDKTHIVNFIGYCTSNVIFLIKVLYLVHDAELTGINVAKSNQSYSADHDTNYESEPKPNNKPIQSMKAQINSHSPQTKLDAITVNHKQLVSLSNQLPYFSSNSHNIINPNQASSFVYSSLSQSILNTIRKFQLESYKQELKSILDIILRMEHNNATINIVQVKFCSQNDKYFQTIVTEFLKKALRDETQTLFSYARYIFQFLAFHIAKFKLFGHMSSLEVAPHPYLSLKFPHTIIIEPYEVLVYQSKENILIRAYAQALIENLSNHCNIVFWTDHMPEEIEPILSLFPKKDNIYTLYRYHCVYDDRLQTFVKPLDRLGGEVENMVIIDRTVKNFVHHKANGIEARWMGEKKDTKLKDLLHVLGPLVIKQDTLKKSLGEARKQLEELWSKKKKGLANRKHFKRMEQDLQSENQQQYLQGLEAYEESKILKEIPCIKKQDSQQTIEHPQHSIEGYTANKVEESPADMNQENKIENNEGFSEEKVNQFNLIQCNQEC